MSTIQRLNALLPLMILAVITSFTIGCSTMPLNSTPTGPLGAPPPESEINQLSPAPTQPEAEPPIPAFTSPYVVYAYSVDKTLVGGTSVGLDFVNEEDAVGKTRDPATYKKSILNASCTATADGNGLPEEYKDPEFQKFCEKKSFNWCREVLLKNFETTEPFDMLVEQFCGDYSKRQAERYVTLITSEEQLPLSVAEDRLYCSCEGHASQPPTLEDPDKGPCTNRANCWLISSQGPVADRTPAAR